MKKLLLPSWGKRLGLALLLVPLLDLLLPGTLGNLNALALTGGALLWLLSAESNEDERTVWCRSKALFTAAAVYALWVSVWMVVLWADTAQAIPSTLCVLPLVLLAYLARFYYELRIKPRVQS
ncbi:hypothetical protein [Hymenobacter koreensis]|uniref:Transmembrane protein n=1 Tax=Hymenobacter koreensis TaxID=1084523 RepID=A0ABP8J352_9BACT